MIIGLRLLMVILSIAGVADASYLTYEKLTNQIPVCGEGFDCGQVLSSPYAQIGPVPLSALGLFFYITVFLLSSWLILQENHPQTRQVQLFLSFITFLGFCFSMGLIFLMGVIIKAWCFYCLISAGISSSLFVLGGLQQWLSSSASSVAGATNED